MEAIESFNVLGSVSVTGDADIVFSGGSVVNILDPDGKHSI